MTTFDSDGDFLNALEEFELGTDPENYDSDQDGMPDGFDHYPTVSGRVIEDYDGIPVTENKNSILMTWILVWILLSPSDSYYAYQKFNNSSFYIAEDMDSDFDGMPDGWEDSRSWIIDLMMLTNWVSAFRNAGWCWSGWSYQPWQYRLGTDPNLSDSDKDGVIDAIDLWPPILFIILIQMRMVCQILLKIHSSCILMQNQWPRQINPSDARNLFMTDFDGLSNLHEFNLGTSYSKMILIMTVFLTISTHGLRCKASEDPPDIMASDSYEMLYDVYSAHDDYD